MENTVDLQTTKKTKRPHQVMLLRLGLEVISIYTPLEMGVSTLFLSLSLSLIGQNSCCPHQV